VDGDKARGACWTRVTPDYESHSRTDGHQLPPSCQACRCRVRQLLLTSSHSVPSHGTQAGTPTKGRWDGTDCPGQIPAPRAPAIGCTLAMRFQPLSGTCIAVRVPEASGAGATAAANYRLGHSDGSIVKSGQRGPDFRARAGHRCRDFSHCTNALHEMASFSSLFSISIFNSSPAAEVVATVGRC
jgi:hypothetical protein